MATYKFIDDKGRETLVKTTSEPRQTNGYWYAWGFRWIKSREQWSKTEILASGAKIEAVN